MDAKQYLWQVKRINILIAAKKDQIKNIRDMLSGIGATDYTKDRVRSTPESDRLFGGVSKMIDLESDINNDMLELCALYQEAKDRIKGMNREDYKAVLELYYLNDLTLEEISVRMHYSFRWVCELHRRALDQFDRMYFHK